MTRPASERARLLLVDDDESTTITLSALLEDAGYDVTVAASCVSARALLDRGAHFDVVLLDYHLKDGLGTALVPEARGRLPGARIVLLTGSAEVVGGLRHAVDGWFVKAGRPDDLLRVLGPPRPGGSVDPG